MSSVPIRPWTRVRLSKDTSAVTRIASHADRPVSRTIRYTARSATIPAITLGMRQAMPLSPKRNIDVAMSSLPNAGCSVFGSNPGGLST